MAESKPQEELPIEPPIGSWAFVARQMSQLDDPNDPFDWDRWKDEQKDQEMMDELDNS